MLTPVGAGVEPAILPHHYAGDEQRPAFNSLYQDGSSLYRDPRAMKGGDVITILISMNDKASLGNNTQASLDDEVANKFDLGLGKGKIAGDFNSSSTTGATGQGQIDRSEKIKVSVGAVVSEVLPNGNLVVSGSQEVARQLRDPPDLRRRHRAAAGHLEGQHDPLRQGRRGPHLVWRPRSPQRGAAAELGLSRSSNAVKPF